jgi:MFS family permease
MIAVALLDVEDDFGVSVGRATWLVSGYLVVMVIAQPIGGRVGDALGHRGVFLAGVAGFLAASALATFAPSFAVLVVLRMLQALAGALMLPSASALLRAVVAPGRRGRMFGWFGMAMGLGAAAGPVIGGGLVAAFGWRAIFAVNIPLGMVALAMAWRALPAGEAHSPIGARPSATGGAALFRRRAYAAATATVLLHNVVLYSLLLLIPVIADDELAMGPSGAGLMVGAMTGAMMLISPVGGRLSDAVGRAAPAVAGSLVAVIATGGLLLDSGSPAVAVTVALAALAGVGVGLAGAALQTAAIESAPERMVGVAAGLFMTVRYAGAIAATGLTAVVASAAAFGHGFAVLTAAALLSVVAASALLPGRTAAMLAGALAGVVAPVALFGALAGRLQRDESFSWDLDVMRSVHDLSGPVLDVTTKTVSIATTGPALAVVVAGAAVVLLRAGRRGDAVFLGVALVGAEVIANATKLVFQRPRPELWEHGLPATSYAFPSGHATTSMALAGAVVALTWDTRWRPWAIAAGVALIVSVGFSRVYLGVHYPSDIIAGWCTGLAWVGSLVLLRRAGGRAITPRGDW